MHTIFVTVEEVIEHHRRAIERYGGSPGLRDGGLLESAVLQAQATFGDELLHPDLSSQAAAYGFHLAKNHPFVDGNKRTAAATLLYFLELNGRTLAVSEEDFLETILALAACTITKEALTQWISHHIAPTGSV